MSSELVIPQSVLKNLPVTVRESLAKKPREKQEQFLNLYQRRKYKVYIAYLRCFVIPYSHYAYLGENLLSVAYTLTIGGLLFWLIIDLFRMPKLINKGNRDVAREILADIERA